MERMGKRCPYAVVVGTTEIKGYRLLFKKSKTGCYATIEQDANESVPAVVWKLSEYDELLLDRYHDMSRKPEDWTEAEIEQQRSRFCSVWQVIEEAELVDEYEAWKEANPNA